MIELTINDRKIKANKDDTILQAALSNNIHIPNLCYDKRLRPYGGCRLCIVEIEGQSKLLAACSSPVQEGMIVRTETPRIRKQRQTVLELLLVHHPLDCPECDQAGECGLQDMAYDFGKPEARFIRHRKEAAADVRGPLIELTSRRCILCGKCVRICRDHQGAAALGLIGRGFSTVVQPAFGEILECDYCGQCVDICPTGAILSKTHKYEARSWFLEERDTICPFCGVGCTLTLGIREGQILRSRGIADKGVNDGNLCGRGRFGTDYIYSKNRLKTPLIRKNGELTSVSWDEALTYIADNLKAIINADGADSIGAIGSPRCTNEDNFALQQFMRNIIGSDNIDSSASFGYGKVQKVFEMAFGQNNHPVDLNSPIGKEVILIIESDITVTHPVLGLNILRAAREGSHMIVVDSRETRLTRHSSQWVGIKDGTGVAFINGLIKIIIDRGLFNKETALEIPGFSSLQSSVEDYTVEKVSAITGIGEEEIISVAEKFATSKSRIISLSVSGSENTKGSDTVLAAANLLNLLGEDSQSLHVPAEYANTYGLYQVGIRPSSDPSYKGISEMLYSEVIPIKALYVMGEDPATTFPDSKAIIKKLKSLEFLIVQDILHTETAKLAHVVLPASSWAEKDGTFTNTGGIAQEVYKLVDPAGQSVPDWMILKNLALRMGEDLGFNNLKSIRENIKETFPATPHVDDNKTFHPLRYKTESGTDNEYPLSLVIRDIRQHSGSMSTSSKSLDLVEPEALLKINEADAKIFNITDNSHVNLSSKEGSVFIKVKFSDDIPEGTLFAPSHFPSAKINMLTHMPLQGEAPVIAVKIETI